MFNVYLDDVRKEPVEWVRTKTAPETVSMLIEHQGQINILSLDHDLGECEHAGTGHDVVLFLEEQVYNNPKFIFPKQIQCHSANPVGRDRIEQVIRKLRRMGKIV